MYVRTKREAEQAGAALKKLMVSERWKVRVWHNLGWNYSIENANITVNPALQRRMGSGERYWCQIAPCLAVWFDDREYLDPNMAVKRAISRVKKCVAEYQEVLDMAAEAAEGE